jgi:hypothetical protein
LLFLVNPVNNITNCIVLNNTCFIFDQICNYEKVYGIDLVYNSLIDKDYVYCLGSQIILDIVNDNIPRYKYITKLKIERENNL